MSQTQFLPSRGSLAIRGDPQVSQPNQKREVQRAVGAQRSGRQEKVSPRREPLVGFDGCVGVPEMKKEGKGILFFFFSAL